MHTKIILVAIIFLMGGFFYMHEMNPQSADFVLDPSLKFNLPVTALVGIGFLLGITLMVVNALFVDLKRVFHDFRIKMEQKKHNVSEDKHRRGVEELLKGRANKAVLFLEKSHLDFPDDIDIVLHLGEAYRADGNYKEALKLLRNSVKNNGGKLELFFAIHKCAMEINDLQSAQKALDDVLRVDSKNKVALFKLRRMAVEAEDWQRALGCQELVNSLKLEAKESAEEKSTMAGILYELATTEYNKNNITEAIEYLNRALKVESTFVPAYILMSILETVGGSIFDSKKTLLKGIDKTGDTACYMFLEDLLVSESAPDEMLEVYSKAVESSPGDIDIKLLNARFYLRLEMVDEALELLENTYYSEGSVEGQGFYIKALLAEAYSRRDRSEKALNLIKQSLDFEKELSPHYVCSNCSEGTNSWTARCLSCGKWNKSHLNRDSLYGKTTSINNTHEKIKN